VGENRSDLIRLEVACTREAPSAVREAFDGLDEIDAVRDDAMLIASELVTNAVLHSGCDTQHVIEVRATLSSDRLLISVDDPCVRGESARLRFEKDPARGGFGLRLVQQLARRWGSERPNGHRVWAELALRG
jgi:anti-sigma regulatory factor (Ser/Thr protein kinase)